MILIDFIVNCIQMAWFEPQMVQTFVLVSIHNIPPLPVNSPLPDDLMMNPMVFLTNDKLLISLDMMRKMLIDEIPVETGKVEVVTSKPKKYAIDEKNLIDSIVMPTEILVITVIMCVILVKTLEIIDEMIIAAMTELAVEVTTIDVIMSEIVEIIPEITAADMMTDEQIVLRMIDEVPPRKITIIVTTDEIIRMIEGMMIDEMIVEVEVEEKRIVTTAEVVM